MGNEKLPEKGSNLAFFKEFLTCAGLSQQALAESLGVTITAVHHWFRTDDVKLSYIITAAEVAGYDVFISIADEAQDMVRLGDPKKTPVSVKRLYFLTCALKEKKLTKVELAEKLGMTRDAISYWYAKDDITIKNLVAAASVLGRNINFRFVDKNPSPAVDRNTISINSTVCAYGVWPVAKEITGGKA